MPNGHSITVHDVIDPSDGAVVEAGLDAANAAAAPLHEVRSLGCFARVGPDVVGGAIGRTWGECCELQQLWVAPAHRHGGLGSDLVRAFERRAAERGCRRFYLETFSFQAPELYTSLGYVAVHALHGFAPGVVKYLMVREPADG